MVRLLLHLDANAVNARQRNQSLNELERLAAHGKIDLDYSETAYKEAGHGSNIRRKKADDHTWTALSGEQSLEGYWRELIKQAIFPSGIKTIQDQHDVEIVLTAKIAGALLVTDDGDSKTQPRGILGSSKELAELGITVLSSSDAIDYVRKTLQCDPCEQL